MDRIWQSWVAKCSNADLSMLHHENENVRDGCDVGINVSKHLCFHKFGRYCKHSMQESASPIAGLLALPVGIAEGPTQVATLTKANRNWTDKPVTAALNLRWQLVEGVDQEAPEVQNSCSVSECLAHSTKRSETIHAVTLQLVPQQGLIFLGAQAAVLALSPF